MSANHVVPSARSSKTLWCHVTSGSSSNRTKIWRSLMSRAAISKAERLLRRRGQGPSDWGRDHTHLRLVSGRRDLPHDTFDGPLRPPLAPAPQPETHDQAPEAGTQAEDHAHLDRHRPRRVSPQGVQAPRTARCCQKNRKRTQARRRASTSQPDPDAQCRRSECDRPPRVSSRRLSRHFGRYSRAALVDRPSA